MSNFPPPPPGMSPPPSGPPPTYGAPTYGAPTYGTPYPATSGGGVNAYASFGPRLGGYLLDGLLYGLLMSVFIVPAFVVGALAFEDCVSIGDEIFCPAGSPKGGPLAAGILIGVAGLIVVAVIYLRALGRTGQTWGRKIVGVKVISKSDGQPIGVGRALGRQLFAGVFSASIFYLGYLWMLWDGEQQTWHDKVVGSIVVRV